MASPTPERVPATTVEDVARAAGVSRQTVSRVLNDHPRVATATRARVAAVIRELGWAPDPAARALGRRSGLRAVQPAVGALDEGSAIAELRSTGFGVVEVPAGSSADEVARLLRLDGTPGVVVRVV